MDNYKPLTDEQIYAIQDTNVDVFYVTPTAFRAIEQAAIENYLAQHPEPQDAQVGKDAERYRAMRHAAVTNDALFMDALDAGLQALSPDAVIHPSSEQFDAMIDAAIAAAKGKE